MTNRKLMALAGAGSLAVILGAVAVLAGVEVTVVAVGALVIALGLMTAALAVADRRDRRRRLHGLEARLRQHVTMEVGELDGRMGAALRGHDRQLADLHDGLHAVAGLIEQQTQRLADTATQLTESIDAVVPGLKRDAELLALDVYNQLEYRQILEHHLRPKVPLPPSRGWAASPDVLELLRRLIDETRPRLVVECGSGSSTVVMAYACQRLQHGRVVALEHDEGYAAETERLLAEHGLGAWGEVRLAPLRDDDPRSEGVPWYASGQLPGGPIDLVFVDGPPANQQPRARYPAYPVLRGALSDRAVIVMDDYRRRGEREVVEEWLRLEAGAWRVEEYPLEKGAVVLRRELTSTETGRPNDIEPAVGEQ